MKTVKFSLLGEGKMLNEVKSPPSGETGAFGGAEEKTVAAGAENQNLSAPAPKKHSCWLVGGIILAVVIVLLFIASFLGFRIFSYPVMLLSSYFDKSGNNSTGVGVSENVDSALVASWDTGCLVPDLNSPWAERHTFTINSNGTANHKRYSGESCATLSSTPDHDDNMNLTIPSTGKINLSYTSGIAAGTTVYDIYQVSGSTLYFGHGFCNCTKDLASGNFGSSEAKRVTALNTFLAYKKK